jgi:hypothetical protein
VFSPSIGRSPRSGHDVVTRILVVPPDKKGITRMHTRMAVAAVVDDAATRTRTRRPRCHWQLDVDGRFTIRWR